MIVETKLFKDTCSKILQAVAKSDLTPITETLELKSENNQLSLNVTNREYYVSINLSLDSVEEFHATVNASSFLKLITQITSDYIELSCTDKFILIKGNGSYKVPLIFNEDQLLTLPVIDIDNPLNTFQIPTSILRSIATYNTRGLAKKVFADNLQLAYYVDQDGCITFSQGACVNNFTLEKPVKFLLSDTVVKLFKLFEGSDVKFTLGIDSVGNINQTKVRFENDLIKLTAITPNANIDNMPAAAIRDTANTQYNNSVVVSRNELMQALNRLIAIAGTKKFTYGVFTFDRDQLIIEDLQRSNMEPIKYESDSYTGAAESYKCVLELIGLKNLLSDWKEEYVNIRSGNSKAVVICRGEVLDVIPEVVMNLESIGGTE